MIQPKPEQRGNEHVYAEIGQKKERAQEREQTDECKEKEHIRRDPRRPLLTERTHDTIQLIHKPRGNARRKADDEDGELRYVVHLNRRRSAFSRP